MGRRVREPLGNAAHRVCVTRSRPQPEAGISAQVRRHLQLTLLSLPERLDRSADRRDDWRTRGGCTRRPEARRGGPDLIFSLVLVLPLAFAIFKAYVKLAPLVFLRIKGVHADAAVLES